MNKLISLLALVGMVAAPVVNAEIVTKEVVITVSDVLVPTKVDHNTDAKVVVSGMFPNSCYSWSRSEVNHPELFRHSIRAMALVSQTMCLMVLVPYTKEISLGRLTPGEHTLRFINGDETWFEKTLIVE